MPDTLPALSIPKAAGIGLRSPHIAEMLTRRPSAGWLEVHAENYMGDSAAVTALEDLRQTYPLSVHGVGLSIWEKPIFSRLVSLDHPEEIREGMVGGKMSGGKLEKVLNDRARDGWQLKAVTAVEVKGRIGPGGVEGVLVTFERPVA